MPKDTSVIKKLNVGGSFKEVITCKGCGKVFKSVDEWVKHNEACNAVGYDLDKVRLSPVVPEGKGFKSKGKDKKTNEQDLITDKETAKTAKDLKKDLDK